MRKGFIFLSIVVVIWSCGGNKENDKANDRAIMQDDQIVEESVDTFSVADDAERVPYNYIMKLKRHYEKRTKRVLTAVKEFPNVDSLSETSSIWFELGPQGDTTKLRSFLQDLLTDPVISGLRIYIGEYDSTTFPPGDNETKNDKKKYKNKLTVGLVATKRVGNYERDIPEVDKSKSNLAVAPYNHGKICPPDRCPPARD